jgi:hypothetical protein
MAVRHLMESTAILGAVSAAIIGAWVFITDGISRVTNAERDHEGFKED